MPNFRVMIDETIVSSYVGNIHFTPAIHSIISNGWQMMKDNGTQC